MKGRDVVAMLLRDGWRLVRTRGSHHHYKHPTKTGVVTVPGTGNDDLSPGTVRSIYKQTGLEPPGRSKRGPT
ncbi:MAG TPA: type II toxin-antitoxin system HicA family toxin [Gemmatimonadaceae bacterium]|nr:type II toxin-antitoxin system HicA family toxin [Gemmatimonadaceae bacterium]